MIIESPTIHVLSNLLRNAQATVYFNEQRLLYEQPRAGRAAPSMNQNKFRFQLVPAKPPESER